MHESNRRRRVSEQWESKAELWRNSERGADCKNAIRQSGMVLVCFGQMNSVNETLEPLTRTLIQEIQSAPEAVQRQVFDFLVFLKARQTAPAEGGENLLPLAQSAWAADWNTPEEEKSWRDL